MSFIKKLLIFVFAFACCASTSVMAAPDDQDGSSFDEELNERDFAALRDFLKAKRALDIAENTSTLTLSGDVRTEWRHLNESSCGERLRGHGAVDLKGRPVSRNDFDMEFNLYFNYVYDRSWAVVHVRYDNSAGVDDNDHPCYPANQDDLTDNCTPCSRQKARRCLGDPEGYHGSGRAGDLHLKKAYFGYNLYLDGCSSFDVELGRRGNLYNVFDSNVQFLSRFDGLLLKYDTSWECVADWYLHTAGFVVDERVNHFAWVAETGFINILDTNIDFKYSFIDWEKNGTNRCFVRNPAGFRFLNSQFTMYYNIAPEVFSKPIALYGAFLVNHAARRIQVKDHKKHQNIAWYAGILIGKVRKEGDWALEVQYQVVQAQAVPDGDCGGICRGNLLDESFTTCSRRGNTNFKGWKVETLYALTDNITMDAILEWSKAANKEIGGKHTYSKFEMEAIYSF